MMPVLHIRRHWRRKERGCAESYNEMILQPETKPDRPDLSHTELCLVCVGCTGVVTVQQ